MAFNGSGVFTRLYNWVTDRDNLINIDATRMDYEMDGLAGGLSNCITCDGQSTVTANIPMNGNTFTGVGAGNDTLDIQALQNATQSAADDVLDLQNATQSAADDVLDLQNAGSSVDSSGTTAAGGWVKYRNGEMYQYFTQSISSTVYSYYYPSPDFILVYKGSIQCTLKQGAGSPFFTICTITDHDNWRYKSSCDGATSATAHINGSAWGRWK